MIEATKAQMSMARRIAAQFVTCPAFVLGGNGDDWPEVKSALAAIIETQRLDAELAEKLDPVGDAADEAEYFLGACTQGDNIAALIRAGDHYRMQADEHAAMHFALLDSVDVRKVLKRKEPQ